MARESPSPSAVIEALERRGSLLARLDEEPHDIRDLRDALDVSRSTVYNATRELEALELVTRGEDGFRLTLFGRFALQKYDRFVTELTDICDVEPELAVLSPDLAIPPDTFVDAEIVTAEPHAPDRPLEAFQRFVQSADRLRGFGPVTGTRYVELFGEQVLSGVLSAELITGETVVEYLLTHHESDVVEILNSDRFQLYETPRALSFGLILADDPDSRLGLLLYDDQGQLRLFLTTDENAALEWGRSIYDSYRADATPLSPKGMNQ